MIKLYDFQENLIQHIKIALKQKFRAVCVVSPCGSGKSIMQGYIAASTTRKKNRILFLVHRKELLKQIEATFIMCGVDFNYCQIGMVQTLSRRLDQIETPSIILTDENHHCLAISYTKIYNNFPKAILLGFTATPIRLSSGGLGEIYEKLINGPSVKWLIENKKLSPYKLFSNRIIDTSKLHTRQGDYIKKEVNKLTEHKTIYGKTIKNWFKLAANKKTIIYCSSIHSSMNTANEFNENGILAYHLDAKTPKKERENVINNFKEGTIKVLCNVDLFGEGLDIVDCECVVLLRPTKSLSLYIQQSMRCMRYKEDKEAIIIDQVGNCYLHGLPDDDRKWSLESSKKKNEEDAIKECGKCFFVVPKNTKICPNCGNEFKELPKEEKHKNVEDIILEEIKSENVLATKNIDYVAKIKTARDLIKFQLVKGYKPGWLINQIENRTDLEVNFEDLVAIQKLNGYKFMWVIRKAEYLNIEIPSKYKILRRYAK